MRDDKFGGKLLKTMIREGRIKEGGGDKGGKGVEEAREEARERYYMENSYNMQEESGSWKRE